MIETDMQMLETIVVTGSRHAYDIGVTTKDGRIAKICVHANNREHAARVATRRGYEVRDVTMVG